MQIYKNLPKTNCKECGLPTCMAFAMQVAAKQRALTDCPHLSGDAQDTLAEASAPPMKLIKIGTAEKQFEFGQETSMFRHEDKFHRKAGIAVLIPGALSEEEAAEMIVKVNKCLYVRVGANLNPSFCAIETDGCPDPAGRAKAAAEKSSLPLILTGTDVEAVKKAADAIGSEKPLLHGADASTIDGFIEIAVSNKLPLAISASNLEELADLSKLAGEKGVGEIVLGFNAEHVGDTIRDLTIVRRAALKKRFRPFGYPCLVKLGADTPESETALASVYAAKYGGIIMIDGLEPWELIPVLTTVQDIYTDPQVPNTVETKLYEIGNVNENSPVLFTTNFSLTYFSVEGEVERSKIPTYISVVDTEGLGVLNSYAGDKISAELVIKTLKEQKVFEKVKHNRLIIPGLLPIFRAEIEDGSEWKEVVIGPETAREIPGFLAGLG